MSDWAHTFSKIGNEEHHSCNLNVHNIVNVNVGVNMDVNIGESKCNWYGMVLKVDLE